MWCDWNLERIICEGVSVRQSGNLSDKLPDRISFGEADGPIVAALRLPEKLKARATQDYAIGSSAAPDSQGRLRGVLCTGLSEAMAASDAGANFLVLTRELPHEELKSLCDLVPIPVYSPGLALEEAWEYGASGVSEVLIT